MDELASHMRISIVVEKPHLTRLAIMTGEKGGPLLHIAAAKVGGHISRAIKSDRYHSDVYTYRKAIHIVLMISTHFESPNPSDAQCSETAASRCSPLDMLPAFVHGALGTQLLHLGIIDVTKSNLESLRSITSQMAAIMQTNEADARKGKSDSESQPIFIRVDDDVAHALQASRL